MARRASLALVLVLAGLFLVPVGNGGGGPASASSSGHVPSIALSTPSGVVRSVAGSPLADPSLGGASARMLVGTADRASVPNDGITTNITAFPAVTFPSNSSFQTGAEEVIGSHEGVFGLFTNDLRPPTAFYAIFQNVTDQTEKLYYWVGLPIAEGASYQFTLERTNGTSWTLTVNGQLFGDNASIATFDYGASTATWLGGVSFSQVAIYASSTTVPKSYDASTAFAVHLPASGWYLPRNGTANFTGPVGASWGIEGRAELGALAPGEVRSGTALAPVRSTSVLWTTGTLPVTVTVALTATSALGLSVMGIIVNVTTLSGNAIANVPLYVADTLGGSATPSTVVTSADGSAATLLSTPNVSAASTDVVRASVSILGYTGSASTAYSLTPPVEILVDVGSRTVTMAPGTTDPLTVQTRDLAGRPYPQVALTLTAEFAGNLSGVSGGTALTVQPAAGVSDPNGSFPASLVATSLTGEYAILVSVASLGAWGHVTVNVTVRPPPPSFWEKYGPSRIVPITGAAIALALLLLVVLWFRRRRAKRAPLPEMDLRRLRQETEPSGPTVDRGVPPVSRTPPGSGTP